jgi:hypothetical protein
VFQIKKCPNQVHESFTYRPKHNKSRQRDGFIRKATPKTNCKSFSWSYLRRPTEDLWVQVSSGMLTLLFTGFSFLGGMKRHRCARIHNESLAIIVSLAVIMVSIEFGDRQLCSWARLWMCSVTFRVAATGREEKLSSMIQVFHSYLSSVLLNGRHSRALGST